MTRLSPPRRAALAATLVLLVSLIGGCKGKSTSGPSSANFGYLEQHNARFNDGRTVRWRNLPVPVFGNGIARPDEVTEWTGASGGAVTFVFVGSPPGQGISVRFGASPDICGITTVEYQGSGDIVSADLRINEEAYRGPECAGGRTVTHEIGHAIGYLDHSDDGGLMDTMGGNGRITGEVAQMIHDLYTLAPGTEVSAALAPRRSLVRGNDRRSLVFVHPKRR